MKLLRSLPFRFVGAASLQVALVSVALSGSDARNADKRPSIGKEAVARQRPPSAADNVQAKLMYCEGCHGRGGRGFRGFYPMPRLAGQQPEYLKNQLQAFVEHRRTNNIMFNVSHSLTPAMIDALAADFQALDPPPFGGGRKSLVGTGERIFQDGVPEANVAACAACHGPDARGSGEIPRLAGQLPDYVFNKLINWSKERGQNPTQPDISAVMSPVAHSLTKPQVEAVAAYLGELK